MNPAMRTVTALVLSAAVGIAAGCGGDGDGEPEPEATGAEEAGAQLETTAGTLVVTKAGTREQFGSSVAQSGFKILVVSLKPADGDGAACEQFDRASKDVYLESRDGARTPRAVSSCRTVEDGASTYEVGFTPRESARDFRLFWPGNPPLELAELM